jgi:phage baseplate assembly protein W
MAINWNPTTVEEIAQNVRTIFATTQGTVPFARDLGLPGELVDEPQNIVSLRLSAAAIKAVRASEPRANVRRVRTAANLNGRLEVVAEIEGSNG